MGLLLSNVRTTLMAGSGTLVALSWRHEERADRYAMGSREHGVLFCTGRKVFVTSAP
jgi:hypothetical protein